MLKIRVLLLLFIIIISLFFVSISDVYAGCRMNFSDDNICVSDDRGACSCDIPIPGSGTQLCEAVEIHWDSPCFGINGDGHFAKVTSYWCDVPEKPCSGGGGCFTGDTKILTSDGEKEIKDIKEGDVVKSFNPETGEITESIVTDPYIIEKKEIYTIETTDGEKIKATAEHPFYVGVENQEDKTFGQKILAPFTKLKSYFVSGLYVLKSR